MSCCDDPTEPEKLDLQDLQLAEQRYGNLVRDLFTDPPERVLLKLLGESNAYLRELAARRAHYEQVRLKAIAMLDEHSVRVLQAIVDGEPGSVFAEAALQRQRQLEAGASGIMARLFKGQ
ncbi:MAG: hypothetical protein RQ715_00820 [Methylococcales bacterium]|nr:hypothetical protein [Methylococcales bacterium]